MSRNLRRKMVSLPRDMDTFVKAEAMRQSCGELYVSQATVVQAAVELFRSVTPLARQTYIRQVLGKGRV